MCVPTPETEETETVTTSQTRTTETVLTTTTTYGVVDDDETEVKVTESHVTTLEVTPTFTKPLMPAVMVDEGGTVRSVGVL